MLERDLFTAAFEIDDATKRRAYLDVACVSDPALRKRIEWLLTCSVAAGDFLEQPAVDLCSDRGKGLLTEAYTPAQDEGDPPTINGQAGDTGRTMLVSSVASASQTNVVATLPSGLDEEALALGTLFGRYRVERVLGTGGMGIVYLAEDLRLGRRVALKIPKFDADGKLHLSERFRREARTMASVQHRNLCPIYDVDEQDGQHYLTMAFIDGESRSQVIKDRSTNKSRGSLGEPTLDRGAIHDYRDSAIARRIAELIRKLALALDVAHRAGVVHRDLKPANVMIDREGEPILMDFGLAWMVHETDSRVTQSGVILGTPAYMSPEQASGDANTVGAVSDIYSLGAILYELLAGRPIFTGSVTHVLYKLMHDEPTRPSAICGDVDPKLEAICWKAISRRPEDRFATAAEFAAALAGFASEITDVRSHDTTTNTIADPTKPGERSTKFLLGEPESVRSRTMPLVRGLTPSGSPGVVGVESPHAPVARSHQRRIALLSVLLVGVLGVVWGMFARDRGGETSEPIVGDSSKPTGSAKAETPVRQALAQADGGQVGNLPHEIAPAKPNVPVDVGKPFVVVREGQDVRTLKTLVSAINELQPGDIIEIRSNERLPIQLAEPVVKPLTIRAGARFRPLLAFVGNGTCDIKADFSVEGCDLDLRSGPFSPFDRKNSTWRFHRCRMWGDPNGLVSKMRVTESVIISIYGNPAPVDGTETDYEFDNCLIRNNHSLIRYQASGSHTLRLRNCTFYAVAGAHPRLAHLAKEATLTVEATGNVFHCQSQATELIEAQSLPQVTWIGADNCFSGNWYQVREGNVVKEKGLPAWNKLWKEPERDSREVDLLAFEWGRVQRLPNPERSLAVRAATEKMIGEHKLPEVGPDWTLVGPGDAYVRALAAEGRAVPKSELRPERRDDGAIVLLRAGKEVRGYVTLTEALDAAQDKDVVELRTDGLVNGSHWTGDSRRLTIRAGAGYAPTIDGELTSAGTDRLILEGLTIRYVLQASGGFGSDFVGDQPLFPTQGSLVRMMNCTLLGERGRSIADAWMFGDGESLPEIVNCDISFLRIGLRSGSTARLRNSVLTECRPNVESRTAPLGTLEIERCVFWSPEVENAFGGCPIHSLSAIKIQAHRSIFVSPVDLTFGLPIPIDWTGSGNAFVKPLAFRHGIQPLALEQFQIDFHTEADSIELPPWEFDPAQWRILRDKSPGYQPRPDGTDYGADIDWLVNALGRDAARPAIAPFDDQQAKAHQQAWAKSLGVPVQYTNSIGMKFMLIPPGEFTMGSTPAEIDEAVQAIGENEFGDRFWQRCTQSEGPQHKVSLTKPIYLGVHEVTQAEFETVMGNNPSAFATKGDGSFFVAGLNTINHPVEKVSWNDAAGFCAKLSQLEKLQPFYLREGETVTPLDGTGYRLPTEAQWEFACRAGTMTKYWIGDRFEDLAAVGWFDWNSGLRTHAVGESKANPFGLHDMHGNVWEYVEDACEQTYYEQFRNQPAIDPRGAPANGSHILRGGHWRSTALICRASNRTASTLTILHVQNCAGFRVALEVPAVKAAIAK